MNPLFYPQPVIFPNRLPQDADTSYQQGIRQLTQRAMELLRAAALIDGEEPGLLTPEDRDAARRRGFAAARRVLTELPKGRAHVAYFRAFTPGGLTPAAGTAEALADRAWILEDRCGLADSYLRAVADAALHQRAECILCPSPLRRDRLEAVFLPGGRALFLSERAVAALELAQTRRVHLDRIPESSRRQALRAALLEDRKQTKALLERASQLLTQAEILRNLATDSCTADGKRI